ncbi:DNA adenine methylase [Citreimonas salinaria]|uniref:DNA adenine methylase n=1 Tax=Citreimonas salinaria TaxID=321339 RepID=A0A1H3KQW0_9RHOB|nr:DNA adenine methylase [Citreimonas salinaria]SDY54553.1 DNA adenine methylase [Citreimonas salinaria]
MTRTASPLRYPGGKSSLIPLVVDILRLNRLEGGHYAEPFAGGGGLALALLFNGHVSELHLNDVDHAIGSLWHAMLEQTDDLVDLIVSTPVTIDEWHRQRSVYRAGYKGSRLQYGFAALFLNRTNRSGIIKGAGVIGGLKQEGNYKLDCRFNKEDIVARVRRIEKYRSQIHFSLSDAHDFVDQLEGALPPRSLICFDPPYFAKGSDLYTSFYEARDHEDLAQRILSVNIPWITTYDNCPEIADLYKQRRQFDLAIQYSVQSKRMGSELLIPSKGLRLPSWFRQGQAA